MLTAHWPLLLQDPLLEAQCFSPLLQDHLLEAQWLHQLQLHLQPLQQVCNNILNVLYSLHFTLNIFGVAWEPFIHEQESQHC